MTTIFRKKPEVRLTNAAGFPPDVKMGLRIRTGDGQQWRVVGRKSDTVLLLGPVRWWHHRRMKFLLLVFGLLLAGLLALWSTP